MKWQLIVTRVAGVWLILSAFLNFTDQVDLWNYLIVGAIVITASFSGITKGSEV